jgi:sterol desaturase/sphingolipid hydroxylase (fatty acid hydroxylase superfamily)
MVVLDILRHEMLGFLGAEGLIELVRSGDYAVLASWKGFTSVIAPLLPLLLLVEVAIALFRRRFFREGYRLTFLIYVANRALSHTISIAAVGFCIGLLQPLALFRVEFTWYGLIYGYLVWEFSHFVYHFFAHKVRLLWCLHSTHHTPRSMNLMVGNAHFFLEGPYADVVRTSICILAGLDPVLLFAIMFIDSTWGTFIHVGESLFKHGRMGALEALVLAPVHHRVHHASSPLYVDTNFCNLLNVWDRLFGTYQNARADVTIEYGITREMNPNSFMDVYFGEFAALWRDFCAAPSLRDKLLYMVLPPGWSHEGKHKTAATVRREYLQNSAQI